MSPQPTTAELQRRIQALEAQVNKLNAAPAALTAKETAAQAVAAINAVISNQKIDFANLVGAAKPDANATVGAITGVNFVSGATGQILTDSDIITAQGVALSFIFELDSPDDPLMIPGPVGAKGSTGLTVYLEAEQPEDPIITPGPAGGQGSQGNPGPPLFLESPDSYVDEHPLVVPIVGSAGPQGIQGLTGVAVCFIDKELEDTPYIPDGPGGLILTTQIAGTPTNDNAKAGYIGEFQSNTTNSTSLTSAQLANATSISLTAGDWDVEAVAYFIPAATTTIGLLAVGVGLASASSSFPNLTYFVQTFATGNPQIICSPVVRVSLSSTTTIYNVVQANFGVSTMTVNGFIRARRIR